MKPIYLLAAVFMTAGVTLRATDLFVVGLLLLIGGWLFP